MNGQTAFAEPQTNKEGLDSEKAKTVLFVCTGNTCRSPMCSALFNDLFASSLSLRADSCGLYTDGSPISKKAVEALIRRGIRSAGDNDYISHRSKPVSEELVANAHMVVGLTNRHAMELMFRYPAYASKIHVMPKDISDPYGGDLSVYEACLREIESALREAFPLTSGN